MAGRKWHEMAGRMLEMAEGGEWRAWEKGEGAREMIAMVDIVALRQARERPIFTLFKSITL
jgi:hypothetical protein